MMTALEVFLLLLIPSSYNAQDLLLNCEEHCQDCKDESEDLCVNKTVLLMDSDSCRCCDKCGLIRSYQQSCEQQIILKDQEDEIIVQIIPTKCSYGYECSSGICTHARDGFCSVYSEGKFLLYHCDKNGDFLPIECSTRHCWCVNPITGSPFPKSKVDKPMHFDNISSCYFYLITTGAVSFLTPGLARKSNINYNRRHQRNYIVQEQPNIALIFPKQILHGIGSAVSKPKENVDVNFILEGKNKSLDICKSNCTRPPNMYSTNTQTPTKWGIEHLNKMSGINKLWMKLINQNAQNISTIQALQQRTGDDNTKNNELNSILRDMKMEREYLNEISLKNQEENHSEVETPGHQIEMQNYSDFSKRTRIRPFSNTSKTMRSKNFDDVVNILYKLLVDQRRQSDSNATVRKVQNIDHNKIVSNSVDRPNNASKKNNSLNDFGLIPHRLLLQNRNENHGNIGEQRTGIRNNIVNKVGIFNIMETQNDAEADYKSSLQQVREPNIRDVVKRVYEFNISDFNRGHGKTQYDNLRHVLNSNQISSSGPERRPVEKSGNNIISAENSALPIRALEWNISPDITNISNINRFQQDSHVRKKSADPLVNNAAKTESLRKQRRKYIIFSSR